MLTPAIASRNCHYAGRNLVHRVDLFSSRAAAASQLDITPAHSLYSFCKMAFKLACLVLAAVLGSSSAARSGDFGRSLLQDPALQSAMCGSQGYIVGQSFCVYIPTGTGVAAWICPVNQPCACPSKQTGRNPFDCYSSSQYSCSTTSPNWPQSGLIKQLGMTDAGACGSAPSAPSMAPVPAPAPGPGPGGAPTLASAPISEPAPAM